MTTHVWLLDKSYSSVDDVEKCLRCGAIRTSEAEQEECRPKGKPHKVKACVAGEAVEATFNEPQPAPKPIPEEPQPIDPLELVAALRQLSTAVGRLCIDELTPDSSILVVQAHIEAVELLRKVDRTG